MLMAESFFMRVLLVSLNIEKLPDPVAPLGLAFLSSALKSAGHEVRCLDLCFKEDAETAVEAAMTYCARCRNGVRIWPGCRGSPLVRLSPISWLVGGIGAADWHSRPMVRRSKPPLRRWQRS